jgi:lactate dehydrogenase-like 2-hydroxyacid dehydrogenase
MAAMKKKILVTRWIFPEIIERLAASCVVDFHDQDTALPPETLADRLADKDGAITFLTGNWKGWQFHDPWYGQDVHHATLGILGMGRIGRSVARRASGFAMRVLYHNRHRLPPESEAGAQWVAFDELLAALAGRRPPNLLNPEVFAP